MIETNRVIAVKDGSIKIASFNPSTLAFAPLQQVSSGSGSNFFDHLRVNDNLHLSLSGDYLGIYLHQFTSALSGNVISSLQIARNTKENSGGMKVIGKSIYVSYINATNQGIIALAGRLP